MRDGRLPTKSQIQQAEKRLSEQKAWLKEEFVPRVKKEFPEFEEAKGRTEVSALTKEDLKYLEPDEEIDSTPHTDFKIIFAKKVEFPNPKIKKKMERLWESRKFDNASTKRCREHRISAEIKWDEKLVAKIKEINRRTTELLTELYETSLKLRDMMNAEYERGNKIFSDFTIEGEIIYKNRKAFPGADEKFSNLLCEMTNHHIHKHGTFMGWKSNSEEENLKEVLYLGMDDWNIEIFGGVPKDIPINYYMHTVFMDGWTYNLNDIMYMKAEDFVPQITIHTRDDEAERKENV